MKPFFVLGILLTLHIAAQAQSSSRLDKQVVLQKGKVRIDTVMQQIYQQTAFKFSFNTRQINPSIQIIILQSAISISELLEQVEYRTGVKVKIVGNHIVLQNQLKRSQFKESNKSIKKAVAATTISDRKRVSTKQHKKSSSSVRPASRNKSNATLVKHLVFNQSMRRIEAIEMPTRDTSKNRLYKYIYHQQALKTMPVFKRPSSNIAKPLIAVPADNSTKQRPFWVAAGTQADELFYPNAVLNIGYRNLYAIVGWNNGSCLCHVRMGIGYNINVKSSWQLQTTGTVGFTGATYPTSALPKVNVKNSLYKLSVLAEKTIKGGFSIQAGPVINGLQTSYFSYNQQGEKQPVAVGALLPDDMDGDKVYTSIEPPYTLLNTYKKERTRNWKVWIGAELGVYYKINFSLKR